MQLETMQYFDETMSGAPDPATATPADVLKWALIDEKAVEYKSYDATLNQITFEEKHGMTEHTIYTFSDKTSRIRSFIDIIDEKTVQVVRNIMHLQNFEISIESEKYSYLEKSSDKYFIDSKTRIGINIGVYGSLGFTGYFSIETLKKGIFYLSNHFTCYRILVSSDSLLCIFLEDDFWEGILISPERSETIRIGCKIREYIEFHEFIRRDMIDSPSNSTRKNFFEAPRFDPLDRGIFNKSSKQEVFEVLPTWCPSTREVYPRVLSSFGVAPQESEKIYYADGTRIFSWKVKSGEHLIIAVGGRDVTAFK